MLVMRDVTERPEAVAAGAVRLVGTDPARIVGALESVLGNAEVYAAMTHAKSPYGDGHAAQRIAEVLASEFAGARLLEPAA